MSRTTVDKISSQIHAYKRKFYINQLIKGTLVSVGIGLGLYVILTSIEFVGRMGTIPRAIMFFGYILTIGWLIYRYIFQPVLFLFHLRSGLSDEDAARRIGQHFPAINDRLLNYLQLQHLEANALARASISRRSQSLQTVPFTQAIDYRENRSQARYLLPSLIAAIGILVFAPQLFTTSTKRIVSYSEEFAPVAPFLFHVDPTNLIAFRNEDHTLRLTLTGDGVPQSAYVNHKDRRIKMAKVGDGIFEYTIPKIQTSKILRFEAAGYASKRFTVEVVNRPNLSGFNVFMTYPAYLGKASERLENVGNLIVPEGTEVRWQLNTVDTESLELVIADSSISVTPTDDAIYEWSLRAFHSQPYTIKLGNKYAVNKDAIAYKLNVIPDEYPTITLQQYQDTILYSYLVVGGNVADDYGLTQLKLNFSVMDRNDRVKSNGSIPIPIQRNQNSQSYFYKWSIDSTLFARGDKIVYHTRVWDNDGVNGIKSSKSANYTFQLPTEEEIEADIEKASEQTSSELEESLRDVEELRKDLQEAEDRLRGKKQMEWQDQQRMEELINKRKELENSIQELQNQFNAEKQKKERFKEQDEKISKQVSDIQELMDELMDEETRKLYEELQRLLEEENSSERFQEILEKLSRRENNLEKELERTLELLKRMKFDYKLEETLGKLEELVEQQDSLRSESMNDSNPADTLAQSQEELKEDFESFEEDMKDLEDLNQDLKNPAPMENSEKGNKEVKEEMEKAAEELKQGQRSKASESQRRSSQKMKQQMQQMQQMQESMEMEMMQANLDDLRDILQNLIQLSFDQEELMKDFRNVDQSDPRFVELGQWQLNIHDDAKIVEDSLLSLAKRVAQMGAFVTREVSDMNDHLDNSVQSIRDRKKTNATSEQQFAMTSMNNLALMLDDVMASMQQNMMDMSGKQSKGNQQQPGMKLSDLQQQLNKQIEDLKRSGKSGRDLSEELAKLAAEQERIRKAMQEMENSLNEGEGQMRNTIAEKMEETELDLVNKQITAETIRRQEEILTRMLEAEDAMRERELDNEREGETANQYENTVPKAFEEYFKAREKEIELLKTVPPRLYPYYKKEVNEYFKRIGNQNFN